MYTSTRIFGISQQNSIIIFSLNRGHLYSFHVDFCDQALIINFKDIYRNLDDILENMVSRVCGLF